MKDYGGLPHSDGKEHEMNPEMSHSTRRAARRAETQWLRRTCRCGIFDRRFLTKGLVTSCLSLVILVMGSVMGIPSQAAQAASSPATAAGYWQVSTGGHCSAVAVQSANQSVVVTASHCVFLNEATTTYKFCPGTTGCSSGVPTFTATNADVHVDPRSKAGDGAYDFAFVTVHPTSPTGSPVAAAVGGGLPISFNPPYNQSAKMYGYPGLATTLQSCGPLATSTYTGSSWQSGDPPAMKMQNNCNFGGGASGGPWINSSGAVVAITAQQISDCLWCGTYNTGIYMGSAAAAQYNIAARVPSAVTVDDLSAGFVKGGPSQYWWQYNGGYANHFWWTYTNGNTISNSATWTPNLSANGNWQVYAFVPAPDATTTNARYVITHNGTNSAVSINQNNYYNVWIPIGTYYFSAGTAGRVFLSDQTYESCCKRIGFDAVQFVWRS